MQQQLKMMTAGTVLLTLTVSIYAGATQAAAADAAGVVQQEFIFESAPFPSCHAATIAEVNGDLVAAFFGGTAERNPDVGIWVSRKEKGSEKWSAPVEVANGVQSPELRYPTWNPVLFQPRGGDLMLFYKVGPKPAEWWGMVTTSSNEGKTWGKPRKLGDNLIGPVKNKPLQFADGEILAGSSTENDNWKVHMERSSDGGKTWQIVGPLNDPKQFKAIQPTLLAYPGGRIQALCRTQQDVIAEIWSTDEGKTWSPMQATSLPNNNSGLDGVTLADGRQLLVYNHSLRDNGPGNKGRGILNVATSRDGKNWDAALIIEKTDEPGRQFSYPSLIQTSDGLVHVVYTWNRKRIKHVVLDPAKMATKPIVDGKWPADL